MSQCEYDTDSEFGGKLISLVSVYILLLPLDALMSVVFDYLVQASYYELLTLKKSMNEKYHIHIETCMHAFNCIMGPIMEKLMTVDFFL